MPFRLRRLVLAAPVLFALAGCGGGDQDRGEPVAETNVVTNETAVAPPVETAPAVAPAPLPVPEERPAVTRNVRDGPGEERAPEYEGARSAATALPSHDDDASPTQASPPPSTPSPAGPQNDAEAL